MLKNSILSSRCSCTFWRQLLQRLLICAWSMRKARVALRNFACVVGMLHSSIPLDKKGLGYRQANCFFFESFSERLNTMTAWPSRVAARLIDSCPEVFVVLICDHSIGLRIVFRFGCTPVLIWSTHERQTLRRQWIINLSIEVSCCASRALEASNHCFQYWNSD